MYVYGIFTASWADECWCWWTSPGTSRTTGVEGPSTRRSRKPVSPWNHAFRLGHSRTRPSAPFSQRSIRNWRRIGGSMTQDQGISQPKDDRIFQNKNLNPNNAKLDPTTNSYQCQSRQSYSAHSLRRLAWRNFSQTEGDIEPSTWASTQTVAVAVGSSSSQSSFGEINAHFYVGVMWEHVGVFCKALKLLN